METELIVGGRARRVKVTRVDPDGGAPGGSGSDGAAPAAHAFDVAIAGECWRVDAVRIDEHTLSLIVRAAAPKEPPYGRPGPSERIDGRPGPFGPGGTSREVTVTPDPAIAGQLIVRAGASLVPVATNGRRRFGASHDAGASGGPQRIVAPMPGKVVRVLVGPGEAVSARQPLVVVEAMKMENELRAARAGSIAAVHVREGQPVDAGALLVVVE